MLYIPHEKNTDEYVKNNRPPGHFIEIAVKALCKIHKLEFL
jgi:hypothetical protein